MSFFDEDDPFEDIMKEFFGNQNSRRSKRFSEDEEFISGEDEERTIDFIETKKNFFVVFELPGYNKEDISIEIKKNQIIINAKKKIAEKMEPYMARKLSSGVKVMKTLPDFIKTKNYDYTFNNGILEVCFKK